MSYHHIVHVICTHTLFIRQFNLNKTGKVGSMQGLISWVVLIQTVNYISEAFCKYLCTLIRDFPSESLGGADSQWYLRGPSASSLEHQDFWVLHSWRLRCSTLHEDMTSRELLGQLRSPALLCVCDLIWREVWLKKVCENSLFFSVWVFTLLSPSYDSGQ